MRRTPPAGSSPMPMTSDASMRGQVAGVEALGARRATTSMPSSSAARRAPARISPGALSPPMASTAMGSITQGGRSDVDGDAVLVPAAGGADDVGQLGGAAPGQSERAGSESRHAPARWLRAFDFDRFFLGTAIVGKPLVGTARAGPAAPGDAAPPVTGPGAEQCYRPLGRTSDLTRGPPARRISARPPGWSAARRGRPSGDPRRSGAQSHGLDVAVGAARRADAGAVVPADRGAAAAP